MEDRIRPPMIEGPFLDTGSGERGSWHEVVRESVVGPLTVFAVMLTIIVSAAGLPSQVAFHIARRSMEQIAVAQLQSPAGATVWADVNIYGSCRFSHESNAVTIAVTDAGFIDSWGFVYCPAGKPALSGRTTPLGGPWYSWYLRF